MISIFSKLKKLSLNKFEWKELYRDFNKKKNNYSRNQEDIFYKLTSAFLMNALLLVHPLLFYTHTKCLDTSKILNILEFHAFIRFFSSLVLINTIVFIYLFNTLLSYYIWCIKYTLYIYRVLRLSIFSL